MTERETVRDRPGASYFGGVTVGRIPPTGLLNYEHGKAAPELTASDQLRDEAPSGSTTANTS